MHSLHRKLLLAWPLLFLFFFCFISTPGFAAEESRFEAITFAPAIDSGDYFSIYGSQNLKAWQGGLGIYFDYANRPLQFVGLGAIVGQRQSVIDHLIIADLYGGLGFTDWFEIGLTLPVVLYNFYLDDVTANEDNGAGLGDMTLVTKFRIVNTENSRVGFAVMPFVTLPSGDVVRYTGNGHMTGGLTLITDWLIHERFSLALNLGGIFRDDVTRNAVRIDDQFSYGLGANIKFLENFHGIIEAFGKTNFRNFYSETAESPFEAGAGLRYLFGDSGFGMNLGGTVGIVDGVGAPRFRIFSGLQWTSPIGQDCPECPPPAPPPDPRIKGDRIVIWGKVFFDTDKSEIKPISYPVLDDVVDVMQKNSQLKLVEVQGHCDIRGGDAYNMILSQDRANAVRDYLTGKGIEASRLTAVGYGLRKPIADNKTKEGMSQNRRVEFVILQKDY